ncbi:hypothetical protein ScPMuIL_001255 [Solemya velum]
MVEWREYDFVFLHGPPFSGKSQFCEKHLGPTHQRLSCVEEFAKNPDLGLRDIVLQTLKLLKQGEKVVLDDENASRKTRQAFISMVKKKLPSKRIHLVQILPEHGEIQCLWKREHFLASSRQVDAVKRSSLSDSIVHRWFSEPENPGIHYEMGVVDEPTADEGFSIEQKVLPLQIKTGYKLEVPSLFIDWEGLYTTKNSVVTPVISISAACKVWSENNPCGRIIVICDGEHICKGLHSKTEEVEKIKLVLSAFVKLLEGCPLYVLHLENPSVSQGFTVPPEPGLLAFLQKQHRLNLGDKNTLYLYQSPSHMKMAVRAGIRHIKLSKVLKNPSLVSTKLAVSIPSIPLLLQNMEFLGEREDSAIIPLYDCVEDFKNGYLYKSLPHGRALYLFARNATDIDRYQELYDAIATPLGEKGSRIEALMKNFPAVTEVDTPDDVSVVPQALLESPSEQTCRELPKWMLGKSESKSKSFSKSDSSMGRSDSNSSTDGKVKKMMYVMSEAELLEFASNILKQAGREDIINRVQLERKLSSQSRRTPDDISHKVGVTDSTIRLVSEVDETRDLSCKKRGILYQDNDSNNAIKKQKEIDKTSEEKCKFPVLNEICDTTPPENVNILHDDKMKKLPENCDNNNEDYLNNTTEQRNRTVQENELFKIAPQNGKEHKTALNHTSETKCIKVEKRTKPDLSVLDEIFS